MCPECHRVTARQPGRAGDRRQPRGWGWRGGKEGSRDERSTPAAPQPPFGAVIQEQTAPQGGCARSTELWSTREPSWLWAEELMQIKIHKRIQPPNTDTN